MYAILVNIRVKPEHVADFVRAAGENHLLSVAEPGNLRFDILQSADDPSSFITYMAYRDEASAEAHRRTAHYLAFRDLVADWMVVPRENVPYVGIFPES